MLFLNIALTAGLAAVSIPIILHLLNRRSSKIIEWGAMRFLLDSVESRKRRIQLEEALLMAARCLLLALLALAVARPFIPPGSNVPWVVVLPCFLLGVATLAVAVVMWHEKHLRKWLFGATALLLGIAAASVAMEKYLNLKRFGTAGRRDIAIIIDGSASMALKQGTGGTTNFDLALKEAEKIIADAGSGTAFSLILGAPVPQAKIPSPVVNRADLREALNSLRPVNGRMASFDCLSLAAQSLLQGSNPGKQIIVLTDAQDVGWDLDRTARWEALKQGFDTNFKSKPELIIRQFSLPTSVRNAGIAGVKYSRNVIGTDRPVTIEVTVQNTGNEGVTPSAVELKIDDETLTDSSISQLLPGSSETVRFLHQFKKPGAHVLTAKLAVEDDLAADNSWDTIAEVTNKLKVLIIDGNPSVPFMQRAGSFTALALAPGSLARSVVKVDDQKGGFARDMVDPEVMPVTRLQTLDSFGPYDVVVLCDVARLAPSNARMLAGFVEAGGGLLIAPGRQAAADFYNDWRAGDGHAVLPVRLLKQTLLPETADPVKASLTTFSHEALRLVADAKQSDLSGLIFTRFWKLADTVAGDPGVYVGGRLTSGDPFLASRKLGQGTVLLSAASLDGDGSNLVTRQAFLPLVHEIIYHLAAPGGQRLNQEPAYVLNVPLSRARLASGLKGEYFPSDKITSPILVRNDPRIEFNWNDQPAAPGGPADNFCVRWTGSLVPKYTEEYTFQAEADDGLELWIGDEQILGPKRRRDRIDLVGGQPVPVRAVYHEGGGNASVKLYWQSQSQRRQIIPGDCLLPFAPGSEEGFENAGGTFDAIGPDQQARSVDLVYTRTGTLARLTDTVVPGLYQITLPEARRAEFAGLLTPAGTLPFTVIPDASEGRLKPLADDAFALINKYLPTSRPRSVEDVLAILQGRQFGEELWKYLAVGALFLLLAEIALSRWIALQRQSSGGAALDFESRYQPDQKFQAAVDRLSRVG